MRKRIVGSSWKMHINTVEAGEKLAREIVEAVAGESAVEIFIMPTFPLLPSIIEICRNSKVGVGAQTMAEAENGAYTGEVPAPILSEIGCRYIELGHAERRARYNETDEKVRSKTHLALRYDMTPLVCIGETAEDKDAGRGRVKLATQTLWALDGLSSQQQRRVILAYEPVWAIGQADPADPAYVHDTHRHIRDVVAREAGEDVAAAIRIIYGGSVTAGTAKDLFRSDEVDGMFVGRGGLKADLFRRIIDAAG